MERDANGNLLVYGKVTDGTIDSDQQIVDPAFAKKALADWYDTGANVRQMHATNLPPAGKGIMLESLPDGEYTRVKVVEPNAQKLCQEGVYQGFSVGIARPRIERDARARGGRIVGGQIVEVSLVDRPANPMAKFAVLKMAGGHLVEVSSVEKAQDPDVGGGVDREDIDKKDFVFPEDAPEGGFPVHSPGDVEDAVSSWGRYKGDRSFDDFKRRLSSIARRKGPEYEKRLPESWRDGNKAAAELAGEVVTLLKAANTVHTHEHTHWGAGPDGSDLTHEHEHRHAPNHGDHSAAHAHTHTEEFVTDEQDAATKAADGKCMKCKGTGFFGKAKKQCPVCGGSGLIEKDGVTPPPPIGFPEEGKAADADAAKAADAPPAASDSDSDADGDDDSDASGDTDDDSDSDSADGKPFGGKKAPPFKKKGVIEPTADGFVLYGKGGKVLGTHTSPEAALAQWTQVQQETAANKAAKRADVRAEKAANKAAKQAAEATIAALHPKVEKQRKPVQVPWLVRRAHDFACSAYSTEDVTAAYPSVVKGDVFSTTTETALKSEQERFVRKYDGKAKAARRIDAIGKALAAFKDLREVDTVAAREGYHAAFKAANPMFGAEGGPALPKPGDNSRVEPGSFKRPYITAGHQSESGHSVAPSIPTGTHPVTAGEFTRGPLEDGHQRYIVSKMAEFHDALAAVYGSDLCKVNDADENGHFGEGRQPAGAFQRPPASTRLDNKEGAHPHPVAVPDSAPSPGNKVDGFVFDKAVAPAARTYTEEELQAALTKALAPVMNKVQTLEREVETLSAQPDPNALPHRGTGVAMAVSAPVLAKAATIGGAEAQHEAGRASKKAAKIEYLQSLARNSDPAVRIRAQERLDRMGAPLEA